MPSFQPITYIYTHLHDSIRSELEALAQAVLHLEQGDQGAGATGEQLARLRERYRFLEQVYQYHSSVEDQVVYPALDSKVKNVTLAYTVEHEDEEQLFDQLAQLLSRAVQEEGAAGQQVATLRLLACKVEEVHTTLRNHLAKEEEQLLPLLLHHFSQREQAELVAQFFCCIPLATVQPVLAWLERTVPQAEQEALLHQVQEVVSDRLLQQLLVSWLAPACWPPRGGSPGAEQLAGEAAGDGSAEHALANGVAAAELAGASEFVCCNHSGGAGAGGPCDQDKERSEAARVPGGKPPLWEIIYIHQAIRSALHSFAQEARALLTVEGGVTPAQLTALAEHYRFIRAVCTFHSASEDDVVFPALKHIVQQQQQQQGQQQGLQQQQQRGHLQQPPVHQGHPGLQQHHHHPPHVQQAAVEGPPQVGLARLGCEDEHSEEITRLEELGRLLVNVRVSARRNSKELAALLADLSEVAESLSKTMNRHMAKEEAEVLPVLMRMLCVSEQRYIVWQVLRAMPLRLLERVMPWVAGKLREEDVKEWLVNIQLAAPQQDAPLVELLSQWARRGKHLGPLARRQAGGLGLAGGSRFGNDDPALYPNQTCGPASFMSAVTLEDAKLMPDGMQDDAMCSCTAHTAASIGAAPGQPSLKRIRTADAGAARDDAAAAAVLSERRASHHRASSSTAAGPAGGGDGTPIDHIFQFHKALRRELRDLEAAAVELHANIDGTSRRGYEQLLPPVEARFQFLRGIYRAHSHAEDNIVFPALEEKDSLINISHSYTLDHKQEEELFDDVDKVIAGVRAAADPAARRHQAAQLSRMCAAIRASLETHLRAEETELWPLFAEHFSVGEQEHLVGLIIGSTGAEVLHSMLSWVQGVLTQEEQEAMMLSLKSASKSTAFGQWLDVALGPAQPGSPRPVAAAGGEGGGAPSFHDEVQATLAEVASYLSTQGLTGGGGGGHGTPTSPADPGSLAADCTQFRPGWEDIFRMNQKQLEAAIRRVSSDVTLEPQRKAYLIQNIMASRYIVAQQRRLAHQGDSLGSTPTAAAAAEAAAAGPSGAAAAAAGSAAEGGPAAAAAEAGGTGAAAALLAAPPGGRQQAGAPPQQQAQQQQQAAGKSYHNAAEGVLGCRHYKRRCRLVAPCCGVPYVCRLCHDEASDHHVDRYAVSEMVCMECGTRQPVAASCSSCSTSMALYYCSICHLFDDDPGRDIYHCPFCNFCRQGKGLGVDAFHCMACNACMSLELFNRHACKEQSLEGTCPVCSDRLFESKHPIKELPCGHFMHSHCFGAYTRYSYTCPICFKSLGDMAVYWRMIDSLLVAERLPEGYAGRLQTVLCNDCSKLGTAPFHFVYHRCSSCASYNTRVVADGA